MFPAEGRVTFAMASLTSWDSLHLQNRHLSWRESAQQEEGSQGGYKGDPWMLVTGMVQQQMPAQTAAPAPMAPSPSPHACGKGTGAELTEAQFPPPTQTRTSKENGNTMIQSRAGRGGVHRLLPAWAPGHATSS